MKTPELKHIPELDGIRGWACLSVLIAHCITGFFQGPVEWMPTPLGGAVTQFSARSIWIFLSGVDLFFVLSGFLIGGILIDQKDKPDFFRNFWIKRVARIFPVAYLLLATYAIAMAVRQKYSITLFDGWLLAGPHPSLLSFATFTQSWEIAVGGYGGPRWMGITWSLAIEEQFYLVFPISVYFLSRRNLTYLTLSGIIIAPCLRDLFERIFHQWYAPYVLLPSRMDALFFGVGIALIVRNERALAIAKRCRLLLDAFALYMFWLFVSLRSSFDWWPAPTPDSAIPPLKNTVMGLMWAVVILRLFTYEKSYFNAVWRSSLLTKIGLISYGVYMYHQAINGLMHGLIFGHDPGIANWSELAVAVAVMAVALVVATISFNFMEMPIRRFAQRYLARRDTEKALSSVAVTEAR